MQAIPAAGHWGGLHGSWATCQKLCPPTLQENEALRQQVEGVVVQMLSVQADASLAQQSVTGLQGQLRAAQQERAALQTQATAARRELLLLQVCSECWVMQIHKVFGHATV